MRLTAQVLVLSESYFCAIEYTICLPALRFLSRTLVHLHYFSPPLRPPQQLASDELAAMQSLLS